MTQIKHQVVGIFYSVIINKNLYLYYFRIIRKFIYIFYFIITTICYSIKVQLNSNNYNETRYSNAENVSLALIILDSFFLFYAYLKFVLFLFRKNSEGYFSFLFISVYL